MMSMYLSIGPVVALVAGILILIMPRLLSYIVAVYLILTGVLGLIGGYGTHNHDTSVMTRQESSTRAVADVPSGVAVPEVRPGGT